MNRYQIFNTISGQGLGEYEATSTRDALNKMAVDAGYKNYDDLLANVPDSYRGKLEIRQVDESYREWSIPYGEISDTGKIVMLSVKMESRFTDARIMEHRCLYLFLWIATKDG